MKSQLEATEMWSLRHMLRIARTDKMSNEEILQRANTSRNLLKVIFNRQIQFVGHIMRKSQLEAAMLTGMIEGKRARCIQRKTFTDWLSIRLWGTVEDQRHTENLSEYNEHIPMYMLIMF